MKIKEITNPDNERGNSHETSAKTQIGGHLLRQQAREEALIEGGDPARGTGKKPPGSSRRLYTDEDPSDTVRVKFASASDIRDTLSKPSFKSKSHQRQSQIINLIHQRVRVAYQNSKDPEVKSRLRRALDYAEERKAASKRKTAQMQNVRKEVLIRETVVPWREQEFGDARGTWRVGDLYDYASNRYDLQKIPVSALEENNLDDGGQTTSDESEAAYISRAMESNLDYPIIVVNYPDGLWIADGTHRTWKARELGVPYMLGWILDWEEILDVPHNPPRAESASSPY